jgi:adenylate kinase
MPRIVFLGPPGAGKGTQAVEVARTLGIPHLSTGDLLRSAVRERTKLGQEAEEHMRAGRLVPDDLVVRLVAERIGRPDCEGGYLLDGFPRNLAQAEILEGIAPTDRVVSFEIPEEILMERLTGRRSCPKCGTSYNLATRPPKIPDRCDREGEPLVHRPDDRPEAVRTRLAVFHAETEPLIAHYRRKGILVAIDARGTPAEVFGRVRAAIAGVAAPPRPA